MLGIALKYGLKLEELMAANPEIDPRFLSIDTVLVIPLGESSPPSLNTPTPVQVGLSEPVCYTTIDLGVWCFLLVENELDKPLENVSVRIFLDLGSGSQVLEKNAFTPLNLVPPGEAMPVMVFFEPPAGKKYSPGAVLVSALPASDINSRYVRVNAKINQIDVDPGGLMAAVEGVISIPRNRKPAGLIRLAAIAYSLEEQVAGVRQIELPGPFTAGLDLPYSIEVFSLGPGISRLEVFAEASPLVDPGQATPTSQ